MSDFSLDELEEELSDFAPRSKKQATYTAREERIIAGFEDIERFFEEHGHLPVDREGADIFERLYAVRLGRLKSLEECRTLLTPMDKHGLLSGQMASADGQDDLDDPDLLAQELSDFETASDITELRHVRSSEEKRAAEEVASRQRCRDFAKFEPIFAKVRQELSEGIRATRPFELKAEIRPGAFFIVGGQMAYVAEMGETFTNPQGTTDARLRVVYDNGTESNLLMRSLQRALHKDTAGRRITDPSAGPLFGNQAQSDEEEAGIIYVLRSMSDHPTVAEHRDVIHKIGVTTGSVEGRLSGAEKSPTYLMAAVEVVATYKIYGVHCQKLEALMHKVFAPAQLDLSIIDRFGTPVRPREWFLVPLQAINEAVELLRQGVLADYRYDPQLAQMMKCS